MQKSDIRLAAFRLANPRSRAVGRFRYCKNGASVKQRECIFCGDQGPSWCGRYRKTKRATAWESTHTC